ncbi:MAG: DUF2085 domain-containing protein [bacterium]|nr:DUF2085 domain-containing protein [bacterium]
MMLAIWIIGFLTPILIRIDNPITNFLLIKSYSNLCHQENEKCIVLINQSMLVCARCTGIYLGAFIAGLISLFKKSNEINFNKINIMSLPMFLDVFFSTIGIYKYSQTLAFITGLAFGGMIYMIVISELENLIINRSVRGNE